MHDIFSNWERRALLFALEERTDATPVNVLARCLVAWRRGVSTPAPADDLAVDRLGTRLRHDHVVQMAEFGVVVYDQREDVVRLADDVTVTVDPPWRDAVETDATGE
jgi:hypothetical protein